MVSFRQIVPVLSLLAVTGILFSSGCSSSTTDAGTTAAAPPPVEVITSVPLHLEIVEWDEFVGRLEPTDFVEVRARVSGYLHSTNFQEGQLVKQGDLLCVIDPRPYEVEVQLAQSELRRAKTQQEQAAATVTQTQAEVQEAEARHDLALKQLARSKTLAQQNAISQEEYDVRDSEVQRSLANLRAMRARLQLAVTAVDSAEAQVASAQASLAAAELNLDYTQIRAPINGRVSSRLVTEGNLISGGANNSTLITTIVSLDPIYCTFDADELSYLKYKRLSKEGKLGDTRTVRHPIYVGLADEGNEFPRAGYLNFVDNRLDQGTGTMRLRGIISNPDLNLTPGLFTRVRIPGSGRHEAILIPDFAIGTDQSEKYVLVVNGENVVERRVVTLGPLYRGLRIIRNGLNPSDRFVLRGIQRVRPGVTVNPTNEEIQLNNETVPTQSDPVPESQTLERQELKVPSKKVAADGTPNLD